METIFVCMKLSDILFVDIFICVSMINHIASESVLKCKLIPYREIEVSSILKEALELFNP